MRPKHGNIDNTASPVPHRSQAIIEAMVPSLHTRANAASAELQLRARILAIDYGRRRLGLAVSDEMGVTAHTLPVIERTNRRMDIRRLRELVKEKGITAILVGFPVHLSGRVSEMAEKAEKFAMHLKKELRLPVVLRDERLTSWEAEQMSEELGLKRGKNAEIDSIAAAILLHEYLSEARSLREPGLAAPDRCEK